MCAVCHGQDGERAPNPQARAFSVAALQNGSDPFSLYRTLTEGFRTMPAQTWMTPGQRYDVVHYLREAFLRRQNPSQYFEVDEAWLASLPPAAPELAGSERVVANRKGKNDDLPPRDFGPALGCQIGPRVPSGLAVRLPGEVTLGYDLHRMASVGAWRGAFLDLSDTHHYRQRGEGIGRPGAPPIGWTEHWAWDFGELSRPARGPYPRPAYRFLGRYRRGAATGLRYRVFGRDVVEWPSAVVIGDQIALVHRLTIGPGTREVAVRWAADGTAVTRSGAVYVAFEKGPARGRADQSTGSALLHVLPDGGSGAVAEADAIRVDDWTLRFAPRESPTTVTVVRAGARSAAEVTAFAAFVELERERWLADPAVSAGIGRSAAALPVITTRGARGEDELPYAVDTLPLPTDNPYGAWLRTSALDFFEDGRCAVATLGGDVWVVDGIDADLRALRWTRFATGLFEPLGLAVVDGKVCVTCRDGLWRLHDRDADGRADDYECVYADTDVSATFHAFNFDLQRDPQGRLSYVKSGRYTSFDLPGAVVRLAPDGSSVEYVATGFRTPNGMGTLPDGSLLVSDNQGQWVPAGKISRIRAGGFYGVFRTGRRERPTFDAPILWLPQEVDSSCGGQLWVDDERFGPLAGHLLHTSFGKGWCYVVDPQEIGDVMQASCVPLPFQFDAGVQRARVNPRDGQVYVVGLSGWQGPRGGADGCLQRIRFTGQPGCMLLGADVSGPDRLTLRFSEPVDAEAAAAADRFRVEQWNYRWTARYGSDQWSVVDPDRRGRDALSVRAARAVDGGRGIELTIPDLRPADQVRIECEDLPGLRGEPVVHMTIRALPR